MRSHVTLIGSRDKQYRNRKQEWQWGIINLFRNKLKFKVTESRYIALFAVSGSIKKLFSIDCVNIYFSQSIVFANIYVFSIFFFNRFCPVEKCGVRLTSKSNCKKAWQKPGTLIRIIKYVLNKQKILLTKLVKKFKCSFWP